MLITAVKIVTTTFIKYPLRNLQFTCSNLNHYLLNNNTLIY